MARAVLSPEAARKLKTLLRGSGEVSRRESVSGGLAVPTEYADPFTVQWAQSEDTGSGAWIIWLPSTTLVVTPDGSVNPAASLTAAAGDYPAGWYVLTDAMLSRQNGGTLYLNVTLGDTPTATFASSASSDADTFGISICTANVDATSGERKVRQFVTSALVVGGGEGGDGSYGCDEASISRIAHVESETVETGKNFYIKGFGKWTIGDGTLEVGSYHPPSVANLEIDGDPTSWAVICRDGNTSTANGNTLKYRKLKIKRVPSPFQYTVTETIDPSTLEPVTTRKLGNCKFYWDGALQSLADFDVTGASEVWLCGTQSAPSFNDQQPSWTWELKRSAQQAPGGGKVLNFKLYEFAQGKPSVDYRDSFLAMVDHTTKDKLIVGDPNGVRMELSSGRWGGANGKPYINFYNSSGVVIGGFASNEIRYKDSAGTTVVKHGLFDDTIDLTHLEPGGGGGGGGGGGSLPDLNVVTDVTFAQVTEDGVTKLQATLTRTNLKTNAVTTVTRDVCNLGTVTVVTGSTYDTSSHQFKNQRSTVSVVEAATPAQDATVFTATAHSAEHPSGS